MLIYSRARTFCVQGAEKRLKAYSRSKKKWGLPLSTQVAPVEEEKVNGRVQEPHRHPVVEQPQHEDGVDPARTARERTQNRTSQQKRGRQRIVHIVRQKKKRERASFRLSAPSGSSSSVPACGGPLTHLPAAREHRRLEQRAEYGSTKPMYCCVYCGNLMR